jgi:CubicO group peptidase (beta-lactamase class C family)
VTSRSGLQKCRNGLLVVGAVMSALVAAEAEAQLPVPEAPKTQATEMAAAPAARTEVPVAIRMTQEDVEAFLDGIMSQRMQRDDMAGAVVAIVKNGEVLLEKGYGYASVEKKTPVRTDQTLFGIGSISKTFVGTAVMQLVQRGRLDLDTDIQKYLDFELRKSFPPAITLRQLLTHTAGFEESGKDVNESPDGISQLGEFLRTHQPAQIFPPGSLSAYSNYGVSLAGYIVERVSGQPFAAYVDEQIFQPLDMAHSTFVAPLPANLAPLASEEYRLATEPPRALEYVARRPAGGMFSTADDMSRYMIAHLQNGRYGDRRILEEATARAMHTIQWRARPDVPGIAINFYQDVGNGRFVLAHGGDLACQHSYLWLVPSENLGVFVAFNSTGTDWTRFRGYLWKTLIDRYLPQAGAPPEATVSAPDDAAAVAGTYLSTRRPDTSILSILYHIVPARVVVNSDNTISLQGSNHYDGTPRSFRAVGKLMFRETGNTGHSIAFIRDARGKVRFMLVDALGEFERQDGLLNGHTQMLLLLQTVFVLVLSGILWPVTAFARWRLKRPLGEELGIAAHRRVLIVRSANLAALVLLGLAFLYARALSILDLSILSGRMDPFIRGFQVLALVVIAGALYGSWAAHIAWKTREGSILHRLGAIAVAVALLELTLFMLNYHFLSIRLNY